MNKLVTTLLVLTALSMVACENLNQTTPDDPSMVALALLNNSCSADCTTTATGTGTGTGTGTTTGTGSTSTGTGTGTTTGTGTGTSTGTGTGCGCGTGTGTTTTAASVQSITPTNNQVLTSTTTTVDVTFNTAMNTTATQGAMSVSDGTSTIGGTYSWSNGNKTLTFTPTALTAWKVHTVSITTAAQSSDGGSFTVHSSSFRIGPFVTIAGTGTLKWMSGGTGITTGTWSEADSFCSGYGMRLATEAEWNAAYVSNQSSLFTPTSGATSLYWTSNAGGVGGTHRYVFWNWVDSTYTAGSITDSTNNRYKRCVL